MYVRTRTRQQPQTSKLKRFIYAVTAACLILLAPGSYAFAESATPTSSSTNTSSCSPVASSPGTDGPTGAWAGTFTYNSCTGLYENKYYTWSPATHTATYIWPMPYTCDTSTWRWSAQQYIYIPSHNDYEPTTVYADTLPAGAAVASGTPTTCTPPPAPQPASPLSGSSTGSSSLGSQSAQVSPTSVPSGSGTASDGANNSATLSNAANLSNYIGQIALSGNASVAGNTNGGSAGTGAANALANVLNSIQSTTSLAGAATFVANVNGNVQGDLLIDPSLIQPASNTSALNPANKLALNVKNTGQINNTIDLNAKSGDAQITNNTTAGNATSGNASAVANVMNMINSMIGANQSFVGVVNINGNLQGNILVPQNFLDSLIASNAPSTTVSVPSTALNNLTGSVSQNTAIANNITSQAHTGQATVTDNTTAGNATSGTSNTNVTIFNLTGSNIVAKNALLVFVNVLGKWVGVIMNAPAGTTAAALGSGVASNVPNTVTATATNNDQITNNIKVAATSGNALVSGNTTAGNATSGNADTAVNLLNMTSDTFSLSNWFGILFINVFGSWYGNFGALTPAAKQPDASQPTAAQTASTMAPPRPHVFQFKPLANDSAANAGAPPASDAGSAGTNLPLPDNQMQLVSAAEAKVLADATKGAPSASATSTTKAAGLNLSAQLIIGSAMVTLGIGVLVAERILSTLKSRS